MLIGLNAIKTVNRQSATILDAWFEGEEETSTPKETVVHAVKTMFAHVQIGSSLKSVMRQQTSVPSLPRHAESVAVPQAKPVHVSPYQALSHILEPNSRSSRWLEQYGLLAQFGSKDCFVDMSMTPDGGMSAVLRSTEGYRRTVVCRGDGTSSQRVTGPRGEEIVRFNNAGDPTIATNKRENALAIA